MSNAHQRRYLFDLLGFVALAATLLAASCGSTLIERFCEEVASLENADLQSLTTSATNDPAVRAELQRISSKFNDVLAASPDEIRADVAVLAGLTAALEQVARETNSREQFERAAALLAAQVPYEDVLPGAVNRYNAYVIRKCTPAPDSKN